MQKLADLVSENFDVWIDWTEGELTELLRRNRLLHPFERFLESHDPDEVHRLTERYGESARPRCTIRFGEWKLFVSLWPVSARRRRPLDTQWHKVEVVNCQVFVPGPYVLCLERVATP